MCLPAACGRPAFFPCPAPVLLKAFYLASCVTLIGLILLCLAWEAWLAPLRPGSWLVLKTVPLLPPLFGILRGKVYTYRWAAMLSLLYFTEGVVRGWSESGLSQTLALLETMLAAVFLLAAIGYARLASGAGIGRQR